MCDNDSDLTVCAEHEPSGKIDPLPTDKSMKSHVADFGIPLLLTGTLPVGQEQEKKEKQPLRQEGCRRSYCEREQEFGEAQAVWNPWHGQWYHRTRSQGIWDSKHVVQKKAPRNLSALEPDPINHECSVTGKKI